MYSQISYLLQLTPLPSPRSVSGLTVAKGLIYAVGGTLQSVYAIQDLLVYDPAKNVWTALSPMIQMRFDPGDVTC